MNNYNSISSLNSLQFDNVPYLRVILIGVLYFCALQFSFQLFTISDSIPVLWLPNAILVTALLREKQSHLKFILLAVFIATFVSDPVAGKTIPESLGFCITVIAQSCIIAWLLQKFDINFEIENIRDLVLVLTVCLLGTLLSALLAAVNSSAQVTWSLSLVLVFNWIVVNFLGNSITLIVFLLWMQPKLKTLFLLKQPIEGFLIVGSTLCVTYFVFSRDYQGSVLPYDYLLFPFLIWASIRLSKCEISLVMVLIAIIAALYTVQGYGPFSSIGVEVSGYMIWLQLYLGAEFITYLTLSIIFEQKTAKTKQLLSITDELANTNSELEEFSYRTSHDLRSPIVSSVGLLNTAQKALENGDTSKAEKTIELAQNGLKKLETLTEDILTLAKCNKLEEPWIQADIAKVVDNVLSRLDHMEGFNEIEFQLQFNCSKSVRVKSSRFIMIVENLISNAIKYRDTNKPHSFVKVSTSQQDNFVFLRVEDNGLGIPKSLHKNMFKMFQRFHPRVSFGSGLGLYLMQKSAAVLGANIEFVDTKQGSIFTVKIPLQEE